jgi:altronate dehydratase
VTAAALVISARDNVATALEPLDAGRVVDLRGSTIVVAEPIPRGHKMALQAIRAGEPVIKYGSPIGTASIDIATGTHVHVHNVASQRGRGDLPASESPARIAEPPDSDVLNGDVLNGGGVLHRDAAKVDERDLATSDLAGADAATVRGKR